MKKSLELCLEPKWYSWNIWQKQFNEALIDHGIPTKRHQPWKSLWYLGGVLSKMRLCRNLTERKNKAAIMALSWPSETRLFPVTFYSEIIPWITDCWPPDFDAWEGLFRRHKMKHIFFSARDAAIEFQKRLPDRTFHWLPEAIDPTEFSASKPLTERSIDVFEMGRRLDWYHEAISSVLQENQKHYFEFVPRAKLSGVLANTKILICFPKSVTHPEAKQVQTVTPRYFEGMAAGCILVGSAPQELIDLFGYNPVIEVDQESAGKQILDVLSNLSCYQDLVKRNYTKLYAVGTFKPRVTAMLHTLSNAGYDVSTTYD